MIQVTETPEWAVLTVLALQKYEDEHPSGAPCVGAILDKVPVEVQQYALGFDAGQRQAKTATLNGELDALMQPFTVIFELYEDEELGDGFNTVAVVLGDVTEDINAASEARVIVVRAPGHAEAEEQARLQLYTEEPKPRE